jgi:hypothetical protein
MLHFAIGVQPAASQLSSPDLPTIFRLFSLPRLLSHDVAGSSSGGLDFRWQLWQRLVRRDILFAQLLPSRGRRKSASTARRRNSLRLSPLSPLSRSTASRTSSGRLIAILDMASPLRTSFIPQHESEGMVR